MSERVLLIEDEEMVRTLVRAILEAKGYEVMEARTPNEALRLGSDGTPVDILLTDVVMPEMNGPQIAAQLAAAHPGLKVLYMSGYTDDAVVRHGVAEGTTAFLQKPFNAGALTAKLREVLDGA